MMQASFDMQGAFAMNRPMNPFRPDPFSPASPPTSPFAQRSAMPFGQQAFSRGSYDYGPSGYSSNYYASQMSRGPDGFSRSFIASSSSFNGPEFDANTRYAYANSGSYFSRQGWGGGEFGRHDDYGWSNGRGPGMPPGGGYVDDGCNWNNGFGSRNAWSDTGVNNGKSTIDLGDYTLDFDKSNSSMMLTNSKSGNQTKIWGDPHIDLNAGSSNQSSGMFNGPLTFNLPGQTRISVGTQPASGNSNISYADNVTITQGNRAYVVNGLSEQDNSPLTVQRSRDGYALAQQMPQNATNLIASPTGTGWYNPQTHAMATASDIA